jgi:hypothetical protein
MSQPLQYGMGDQRSYNLYYRHSGHVPIGGALLAGVVGTAAGVIGALVYAYFVLYVPFIYINFIATLAFGVLIGFVTARMAKAARVRNVAVTLAIVLVVTLVSYYFCWIFWINGAANKMIKDNDTTVGDLIASPRLVWVGVRVFNQTGTWSLGRGSREAVSGWFLTLIWVIEAGAIFLCSLGMAAVAIEEEMYCEKCRCWCGKGRSVRRTEPSDPDRFRRELEAHNLKCLNVLGPGKNDRYWEIEYHHCDSCDDLHAMTLTDHTVTHDKKGNASDKTRVVVDKLLLSAAEAQELLKPRPAPVAPGMQRPRRPPADEDLSSIPLED